MFRRPRCASRTTACLRTERLSIRTLRRNKLGRPSPPLQRSHLPIRHRQDRLRSRQRRHHTRRRRLHIQRSLPTPTKAQPRHHLRKPQRRTLHHQTRIPLFHDPKRHFPIPLPNRYLSRSHRIWSGLPRLSARAPV